MIVRPLVGTPGQPLEPVEIQLPLKAGELPMLEVRHHGRAGKVLGLTNHEASPMLLPPNDAAVVQGGGGEEGVQPLGKGLGDAPRVGRLGVILEDDGGGMAA